MSLVAPGVELVFAIFRTARLLIIDDFPTFDLPTKDISGIFPCRDLSGEITLFRYCALRIFTERE